MRPRRASAHEYSGLPSRDVAAVPGGGRSRPGAGSEGERGAAAAASARRLARSAATPGRAGPGRHSAGDAEAPLLLLLGPGGAAAAAAGAGQPARRQRQVPGRGCPRGDGAERSGAAGPQPPLPARRGAKFGRGELGRCRSCRAVAVPGRWERPGRAGGAAGMLRVGHGSGLRLRTPGLGGRSAGEAAGVPPSRDRADPPARFRRCGGSPRSAALPAARSLLPASRAPSKGSGLTGAGDFLLLLVFFSIALCPCSLELVFEPQVLGT